MLNLNYKRFILNAIWVLLVTLAGSIVLMIAGSRVGEHKSSTFGSAYRNFQNSWGGEIEVKPPIFYLKYTDTTRYSARKDSIKLYLPRSH